MLGMGVYFARGQKDEKECLLAGGKVHWVLLGASFVATSFSGVSFAGIPGFLFQYDPRVAIQSLGALLSIPIVLLLVPRLHALKTISAYEFLERRYHPALRYLASGMRSFAARSIIRTHAVPSCPPGSTPPGCRARFGPARRQNRRSCPKVSSGPGTQESIGGRPRKPSRFIGRGSVPPGIPRGDLHRQDVGQRDGAAPRAQLHRLTLQQAQ
jgi:hypothetical protein